MVAVVLALVSALGFSRTATFARVGMQAIKPLPSSLLSTFASFSPSLLLALLFARADIGALPAAGYFLLLCLGGVSFVGGRTLNYISIDLLGASRSRPFVGTSAVFATIFAIAITGERPHPAVVLGTALVAMGLAIATGDSVGRR